MKYEESPVLELKERINVDFKKERQGFARPCRFALPPNFQWHVKTGLPKPS